MSPLVSADWLAEKERQGPDDYYRRTFLAEFTDSGELLN